MYGDDIAFNPTADLRACQYKFVSVAGTIAANGTAANGILQNKPNVGEDGTIRVAGRSKFVAGGAVAAGGKIMVTTSGYGIAVTSGYHAAGFALAAVNSGAIGEGYFNLAGAKTALGS